MAPESIFSIQLRWQRLPGSPLLAVRADGLANAQLRHYARRAGLRHLRLNDGTAAMVGATDQRETLLSELESAGYEIEEDMT